MNKNISTINSVTKTHSNDLITPLLNELFPELSEKEVQCVYWLSLGLQSPEIGDILNLSTRTIDNKIKDCLAKLNINSRVALHTIYHRRLENFHLINTLETKKLLIELLALINNTPLAQI